MEETDKLKSFYEPNGVQLNKDGLQASAMFSKAIDDVLCHWLDLGYSPSECREMLFTQVFTSTSFQNAMRLSKKY